MSAKTEVTKQEIGFRFHISIDKELHVESGTKTPDKITVHASLEGNENTYADALKSLVAAKNQIMMELSEAAKETPKQ